MRKLGRGQSATFCVSPEMQRRIRTICSVEPSQAIAVIDVLEWAISETWDEEVRSMPLWENQDVRHLYQETVWNHAARKGKFTQKMPKITSNQKPRRWSIDIGRSQLQQRRSFLDLPPSWTSLPQTGISPVLGRRSLS